jgi:hypothetical protein
VRGVTARIVSFYYDLKSQKKKGDVAAASTVYIEE